jgi:hypothetical protein
MGSINRGEGVQNVGNYAFDGIVDRRESITSDLGGGKLDELDYKLSLSK